MSQTPCLATIVLAAGEGTRMRSRLPKVLHPLGGRTLLGHAVAAAQPMAAEHLVVVIRHCRDQVAAHVAETMPGVIVADQDEIPGTGRAVACALEAVRAVHAGPLTGTVVVTLGDVPLLQPQTLAELLEHHHRESSAVTMLTTHLPDPSGYGRVMRSTSGAVLGIVEQKDATAEQLAITEINSGVFAFDADFLLTALGQLTTNNAQGEMYLTDVPALALDAGRSVSAMSIDDVWQVAGVNDKVQLAQVGAELNHRVVTAHQRAGVSVIDPATTWIDVAVQLEPDVVVWPGTHVAGSTVVASGAVIGPDTTLTDCVVGADASVVRSHAIGATIGAQATVGPFSFLRPGAVLATGSKVGAYCEVKNSSIGAGAKVPHLSYIGDAEIGAGTNIGAATVVVNYDGVHKHRTVIGEHVRIGSDSMLVAPITIGDGAYTAAGSVITDDIPAGALGIARGRQRVIEGWVASRRPGTVSAQAAATSPAGMPHTKSGAAMSDVAADEVQHAEVSADEGTATS